MGGTLKDKEIAVSTESGERVGCPGKLQSRGRLPPGTVHAFLFWASKALTGGGMSLNSAFFWQSPGPSGATRPTKAPGGLAWMEGQPSGRAV